MIFVSPTKGNLSFDAMFADLVGYVKESPRAAYKLIIGTDSHTKDDICFVTAIIIHRVGKGARYYYCRSKDRKMTSLRQRIYFETALSLSTASRIAEQLAQNGYSKLNIEVHLDVGQNGQTRDLIKEVVGMVVGSGFDAKIKPDSYGATKVADKHSK
jgi:predicted RNase H-related nuclease YkuK (DUF458 family)